MTTNPDPQSTAEQEADRVSQEAKSAAQDVGQSAKGQAKAVTDEAANQVKSLASSLSDEASSQASSQQKRLAQQSRAVSDDLQRIARGERAESDMVNQFVAQAADRAQRITHELENKEPRELLDDVRRFASRRPGLFLAIAVGVGVVAGRLTRGLTDSDDDEGTDQTRYRQPNQQVGYGQPDQQLGYGQPNQQASFRQPDQLTDADRIDQPGFTTSETGRIE